MLRPQCFGLFVSGPVMVWEKIIFPPSSWQDDAEVLRDDHVSHNSVSMLLTPHSGGSEINHLIRNCEASSWGDREIILFVNILASCDDVSDLTQFNWIIVEMCPDKSIPFHIKQQSIRAHSFYHHCSGQLPENYTIVAWVTPELLE